MITGPRQYLTTQVHTARGAQLVVYLYEEAIKRVHEAGRALRDGRAADCGRHVGAALDILIELSGGLDFESAPDFAARLMSLYSYLIQALAVAQKNNDARQLRVCEAVLHTLCDGWRHAAQSGRSDKPAPADERVAVAV